MDDMTQQFSQEDIQATKGLACLSYIWLLFLVPMLVNKESAFTKFHVNQGIVLFILTIIGGGVSLVLGWIPLIGWVISRLIQLALLALMIIGIINAAQGHAKRLPIIGNIELYK